jgi:transcriptional regulator with XRE-family HTH domain
MAKSKRPALAHQRSLDAADAAVAPRVREWRRKLGMSQTKLADRLGITFQQVQKYENGKDRISIGRLSSIAEILCVSMTFLLTGKEEKRSKRLQDESSELLLAPGAVRLLMAFDQISNLRAKAAIVKLAVCLSKNR